MSTYKVPQDVEAEDKLLGPFSFRQFVYLLIAAALIAVAVGLAQIFLVLAIIPIPPALLFLALALPLKKDQPMEVYLGAKISYFLKPHTRLWTPGQRETTIHINAPKKNTSERLTRDISGEEASNRLSFLAGLVDSEGRSIKNSNMRDDLVAEANSVTDIYENHRFDSLSDNLKKDEANHHQAVVEAMKQAINQNGDNYLAPAATPQIKPAVQPVSVSNPTPVINPIVASNPVPEKTDIFQSSAVVKPLSNAELKQEKTETVSKSDIMNLANNHDYSVSTIAKEAKRMKRKDDGEVFISLH